LASRYPLILLSNTNELHFENIRARFPLLGHFHHLVLSYQVGAAKPSRRIYDEAVKRAGCLAEECFFTDDVPAYVEGAKQAGIDAVRFLDYPQLEGELRARQIV
jgi:HAD superfamily hydrolase (TIGR01509 family)